MAFTPSVEKAHRLLLDYADLQRAADRLLLSALEMGVNPTDVRALVAAQREMLGGALAIAVGQLDLIRIFERDSRLPVAAEAAIHRDAPVPAIERDHGHDETGLP